MCSASPITKMFAGCGSPWKKPVAEDHRHPRLGHQVGEAPALLHLPRVEREVGELDAFEQLEREHTRARVAPVDARDVHVRVAREAVVEGLGVACLEAVVELLADRACELVDELARVDELECPHPLSDQARGLVEQRQVGLDLPRCVRALDLDGDAAAVREGGAVHLADRGGGDRRRVEVGEELLDAQLEVLADDALDVLVRDRPDVVLELLQLGHDVGRDDVGAGREELAELDEGRAELVEHLAQVPAALGGAGRGGAEPRAARAAGRSGGGLEEVAEAVPDRDLGDLGDPAEVPAAGRARHALSVTRAQGHRTPRGSVGPCPRSACSARIA
jgi:hypothetical protein